MVRRGGPVGTTMTRKGPKRPDDGAARTPPRARASPPASKTEGGTDEGMRGIWDLSSSGKRPRAGAVIDRELPQGE